MKYILLKGLAAVIDLLVDSLLIMLFWNAVIPKISSLTDISYDNAVCLYILCNVLKGKSTKGESDEER